MQKSHYIDANILLFDRTRVVRKQTRSVLNVLGFKTFQEFQDLESVRLALCGQRVDVAVLNLDAVDCGVLRLIQDLRGRRFGIDPFVPILLTTWDAKLQSLRPVLESGADDVLLYPFSTAQMGQRINNLVHDRKPFVVTEDYFGPDRRATNLLRNDPTSIVVPNALRAHALADRSAAPNVERIEDTFAQLRRLKIRNLARRIWYLANRLKESYSDPALPDRYERELVTLRKSVIIYHKTLLPLDGENLRALFNSLTGVLGGMFGKPPSEKSFELLEQSALALRVASKLEHEQGDDDDAISGEVAKIGKVQGDLIRAVLG